MLVAAITWFLWLIAASYAAATLRAQWPDVYAKLGAPVPERLWQVGEIGSTFDGATLLRRFRHMGIENRDLLLQLELTCWLRWASIISLSAAIIDAVSTLV